MKYFGLNYILFFFKGLFINDVQRLEKDFSNYIGTDYALATSYGRTALYLGLKAVGVKGQEVILPSFTCTVVRQAVVLAGAKPRFVDVQFNSFDFDMEQLLEKITSSTKVIVVTHYFGTVSMNLEEILRLGKEKGIVIIEDCAHSLGAEYKGRKIGSYGDLAIFSLTKGLVNFGGGILTTNNKNIYSDAKSILQKEKTGTKRRIADFPLVLMYGIEQMIDKLFFDRVKKSILKWWGMNIPALLLKPRNYSLLLTKIILSIFRIKPSLKGDRAATSNILIKREQNPYPLEMERIIASVARHQLSSIESIVKERKKIAQKISRITKFALRIAQNNESEQVFTNIVFRFMRKDLNKIISFCKDRGLLLRSSWPTHQKLWPEQQTETVKKFANEILIWNVNPMLTDKEIDSFIDIINKISC